MVTTKKHQGKWTPQKTTLGWSKTEMMILGLDEFGWFPDELSAMNVLFITLWSRYIVPNDTILQGFAAKGIHDQACSWKLWTLLTWVV